MYLFALHAAGAAVTSARFTSASDDRIDVGADLYIRARIPGRTFSRVIGVYREAEHGSDQQSGGQYNCTQYFEKCLDF